LKEEERIASEKANEARLMKERVAASKNASLEDLTRGVLFYQHLGLKFVRSVGNRLKMTFTNIDKDEPSRQFSFIVNVTDDDTYAIEGCSPIITQASTIPLMLEQLNKENDFKGFVIGMRAAFVSSVVA
jgi:hypothetical protein